MITEEDYTYLCRFITIKAHQRWDYDGRAIALDEYLDAGHTALLRALEQYAPDPQATFRAYARSRITYALLDVLRDYWAWKFRSAIPRTAVPHDDQIALNQLYQQATPECAAYMRHILEGGTATSFAATLGITPVALALRLRRWRRSLHVLAPGGPHAYV